MALIKRFHDGADHLVGLQAQGWHRQTPVLSVQKIRAEKLQTSDGPVKKRPYDRLGGLVAGQGVQVELNCGSGVFFGHGEHTR